VLIEPSLDAIHALNFALSVERGREDNRDRPGCRFGGQGRDAAAGRNDDSDRTANQISRQL
jgi:hypothetical protein